LIFYIEKFTLQFDNAVNFVNENLNGVDVLKHAINGTDGALRSAAALVLGSAAQK